MYSPKPWSQVWSNLNNISKLVFCLGPIYCCCVLKVDEGLPYRNASIYLHVTERLLRLRKVNDERLVQICYSDEKSWGKQKAEG